MERVQFQQEQMLAELKDLIQKGLFTQKETKEIIKKRTAFETALVRRVAKKADFLRYAAYEMGLEQLRRKRIERLKLPPSPPSVSDYALVRRQFHIFERALKKFKADVGLWIQYIQVAKREGARVLQGRITARALQLHPNTPALYILAASQELDKLSTSAARTLLQRGIRLNVQSVDLWREHVKLELGFIDGLRKKWDVGLDDSEGNGKGKARDGELDLVDEDEVVEVEAGGEGEARKEIMGGAIVKAVISSAVKAIPKVELFVSLQKVMTNYPSPPSLRQSLLTHLHGLLRTTLPDEPDAIKLLGMSFLTPGLEGEAFIDALKHANEELLSAVSYERNDNEGVLRIYAEFVEERCGGDLDNDLRLYLVGSLHSLIQRTDSSSPSLLTTHIRLMHALGLPGALKTARRYTSKAPKSAHVWIERLNLEKSYASQEQVDKAWMEARKGVAADSDGDLTKVWLWGLEQLADDAVSEREKMHEKLLKESMRDSTLLRVHELLLMSYVTVVTRINTGDPGSQIKAVRHIDEAYLPTGRVWAQVFALNVESGSQVVGEIIEKWQRKEKMRASIEWAEWLYRNGEGKRAKEEIVRCGSMVGNETKKELEGRWRLVTECSMRIGQ